MVRIFFMYVSSIRNRGNRTFQAQNIAPKKSMKFTCSFLFIYRSKSRNSLNFEENFFQIFLKCNVLSPKWLITPIFILLTYIKNIFTNFYKLPPTLPTSKLLTNFNSIFCQHLRIIIEFYVIFSLYMASSELSDSLVHFSVQARKNKKNPHWENLFYFRKCNLTPRFKNFLYLWKSNLTGSYFSFISGRNFPSSKNKKNSQKNVHIFREMELSCSKFEELLYFRR